MAGILYIPFWRAGGWEQITYRTQLYFTPLSQGSVRLGIYFFSGNPRSRLRTMLDRLGIVTWLVAAALLILWGVRLAHHFNILYYL